MSGRRSFGISKEVFNCNRGNEQCLKSIRLNTESQVESILRRYVLLVEMIDKGFIK